MSRISLARGSMVLYNLQKSRPARRACSTPVKYSVHELQRPAHSLTLRRMMQALRGSVGMQGSNP